MAALGPGRCRFAAGNDDRGISRAQAAKIKRENAELCGANAILKTASAFLGAELCATRRSVYREVVREVASESWCKSTGRFAASSSAYGLKNSGDRLARGCR